MSRDSRKYIFITGGVLSGLGKGTMAAALGRLLKARGISVTNQKFDPYINVDPGTMSPLRHGEVFVTDDGTECDLDVGNYERFTDENLPGGCSVTIGKVYQAVIERERMGGYEGEDIQVIPHITDEIRARIRQNAESTGAEVAIIEIGGTVGDIESLPLLEAIRQIALEETRGNVLFVHLTLVPYMPSSGEMKSKPTQHSVKELLSFGIQPDIIVCRSQQQISEEIKDKIALFCNVSKGSVIQNPDVSSIYDVPLVLEKEGLARLVCEKLALSSAEPDLTEWRALCERRKVASRTVSIALVGKYVETKDAYLSVTEALDHAAISLDVRLDIRWTDAEKLETEDSAALFKGVSAIIVPGGFGKRGFLGKMQAAKYAREHRIPFLGISLGMQAAVVEFARSVLGYSDAFSTEYDTKDCKTSHPVIDIMPELRGKAALGGTILRGAIPCAFAPGTLIQEAYNNTEVSERHRHRYEVNNKYKNEFESHGLRISSYSRNNRIEAVEYSTDIHPWFLGVQFHPEFKSRPNRPHPLFTAFVKACVQTLG